MAHPGSLCLVTELGVQPDPLRRRLSLIPSRCPAASPCSLLERTLNKEAADLALISVN